MVLVDSSHEDVGTRIPDMPRKTHPEWLRYPVLKMLDTVGKIGIVRLAAPESDPRPAAFSEEQWATLWALQWQAKALAAEMKEGPQKVSVDQVRMAGDLGNMPLIVLTAGEGGDLRMQKEWIELQGELTTADKLS